VLELILDPGEAVVSTHGDLAWMTTNIQLSQTTNTGGAVGSWPVSNESPVEREFFSPATRPPVPRECWCSRQSSPAGSSLLRSPQALSTSSIATDGSAVRLESHQLSRCSRPLDGAIFGGEGFILQRLRAKNRLDRAIRGDLDLRTSCRQSLCVHPGHVGAFHGHGQLPDNAFARYAPTTCFGEDDIK